MRLFAHVWPDGAVEGFVAVPYGEVMAMVMPPAGTQLCEIVEHDLHEEDVDVERLTRLRDNYSVDLTPARGTLVRREPDESP